MYLGPCPHSQPRQGQQYISYGPGKIFRFVRCVAWLLYFGCIIDRSLVSVLAEQIDFTILSKKLSIVYLIFRFDVRTAMDPTVVLSNIGADALELATKMENHSLQIEI